MSRLQKFRKHKNHPMFASMLKKLSKTELILCERFLIETEQLSNDDFMTQVNRWYLDKDKPKNYTTMWALVMQSKGE